MNQGQFAAALLDAGMPVPGGVTCARGDADPVRFAVYRNNVAVALITALRQRFPVTRRLCGDEFFDAMARAFTRVSLPSDPLIFSYGDGFPDFIADFPPARDLAYLADTARLEANWTRAYHAADAPPMTVEVLATVSPDRLGGIRLRSHPATALVSSAFAVGTIWQAHQQAEVAPLKVAFGEHVLITRPEFDVRVHVIPEPDAAFAGALLGGASIDDAALAGFSVGAAFDVGQTMVGLISLGAFAGLANGGEHQ